MLESTKYHKINTVFYRDPATNHKTLLSGYWSEPEFELLRHIPWEWTEKVDGTNIRVIWEPDHRFDRGMRTYYGNKLEFRGKTDAAEIPKPLLVRLNELFTPSLMYKTFPDTSIERHLDVGDISVTLYGEGYGNKIQKVGKRYREEGTDFVLFDVNINGIWLDREDVDDIANKLGIQSVPVLRTGTLWEAIDFIRQGKEGHLVTSKFAEDSTLPIEGIVCRPRRELLTKTGKRIITKIKYKDFLR